LRPNQTTIGAPARIQGAGLHTGAACTLALRPADPDTGVVLHLATDNGTVDIPVTPDTTGAGLHRTVAAVGPAEVHTVEHLLAALYGRGVDNVHVDLSAPEPPGTDGSALPFVQLLDEAGIVEQDAPARPFTLQEPVTVYDDQGGVVTGLPHAEGLKLTYVVHYPQTRLAQGVVSVEVSPQAFAAEVAPARTFCLEEQAQAMRKAGCGRGASTENTLVLRGDEVVDNELRFEDECARHKLLDLLGDLAVLGRPLGMHVVAVRSGHALNAQFVQAVGRAMAREDHPRGVLDIRAIEDTLPHRYPFLLVDRILELEPGRRVVGLKNVTRNEEFFQGHFPGQPVMPGVLQIEALAQTGGVMMLREARDGKRQLAVLMAIDDVKCRRPVFPGDQLHMEVDMERKRGRMGTVRAVARVNGEVTTQARIKYALVDAEDYF